jgi:hypothetical protein
LNLSGKDKEGILLISVDFSYFSRQQGFGKAQ